MKKRIITVKTVKQINGQSVYVYEDIEVNEEVYLEMMRQNGENRSVINVGIKT